MDASQTNITSTRRDTATAETYDVALEIAGSSVDTSEAISQDRGSSGGFSDDTPQNRDKSGDQIRDDDIENRNGLSKKTVCCLLLACGGAIFVIVLIYAAFCSDVFLARNSGSLRSFEELRWDHYNLPYILAEHCPDRPYIDETLSEVFIMEINCQRLS